VRIGSRPVASVAGVGVGFVAGLAFGVVLGARNGPAVGAIVGGLMALAAAFIAAVVVGPGPLWEFARGLFRPRGDAAEADYDDAPPAG
jgi:hypothetical protein